MDLQLTGKSCVVTGASRGIGRATAGLLAAEGANVLLVGRDADALAQTTAAHAASPGRTEACVADVTELDAADTIVGACEAAFGPADVLVNNAGTSYAKPLEDLEEADWELQWQLNVMGPMRLMLALAPAMAQRGGGRIVNVASSSGKRPSQANVAYSVAKAAQLSLSRSFADAYAGEGVHVNAVAPGVVATGLWMDDGGLADQNAALAGIGRRALLEGQAAKVPLGRFGEPEQIARVIVALCSVIGDNVAGAAWSVDGGSVPVII